MGVIAYDKPVKNLIAELSATGHVTHSTHTKTSVTLHHNASVNSSHENILAGWRTRAASAHFDVDKNGAVAQYVNVKEYAWAVGNTSGNNSSISIEMANSHAGPNWEVSETTWKSACRLAGWLFYHVVGARPTKDNFFPHQHWYATACPGPYMMKHWNDALKEAQAAYDSFKGGKAPTSPAAPTHSGESVAQVAKEVIAGEWGNGDARKKKLEKAGYNYSAVQAEVNRQLSGKSSSTPAKKTVSEIAAEVIQGKWGNDPQRSQKLKSAGYDANAVQTEVNRQLGAGSKKATPKKTVSQIATEVIAGKWGNGADRKTRLIKAGYNYNAVQAEVNKRLS